MFPKIISIGGITIQSYGLMMAIGFILCYALAHHLAKRTNRNPDDVQTIVMLAAIGGVLGARSVYVWQNWATEFADNPLQIFKLWQGGLVFYGGFIAATVLLALYARLKHERLTALFDFCAIFVPLGQMFGRVGCFCCGCCYGKLAPEAWYAVSFPKGSPAWLQQCHEGLISSYTAQALPVCPTQLFEALGCGLLFIVLWWLYRRYRSLNGLCAAVYCFGYACLRFAMEFLRNDPRGETYFGLSFSQIISIGLLMLAILFITLILTRREHGTVCSQ